MQQDHRYAGRVGLVVEPAGQRAARTAATLPGLDEHQHQVGGGRLPDERRDPARDLGPLCRQQPDDLAVALREPGPRAGPGDQAGGLLLEGGERPGPFGDRAEQRVPPDDLEAEPRHGAGVAWPGSPDPQAARCPTIKIKIIFPERTRASPRPSRHCPGGEDLQRGKPVAQQRAHAVHIPAGPVDHRRGVRIGGSRHAGQMLAPPLEQPVKTAGHAGTGDLGPQPEPAGGSPGHVKALRRSRPVLAVPGGRGPPVAPAHDQRRAAARRRRPRHGRRQQRVDPPPALEHPRPDVARRIRSHSCDCAARKIRCGRHFL